ncbi:MAG: Rz1-like lysis system protein LysC [Terriglobia bacterium]
MNAPKIPIACLVLLASGCATLPAVQPPPHIVTVTHTVYRPIPAAYLLPCPEPAGVPPTNQDLLVFAQVAYFDLKACNQNLLKIKTLMESVTPPVQPRKLP